MPFLELFDETLDINATDNYVLSLQVSYDDLSFCILDSMRNKFIMLRSYTPEENSRFNHEKIAGMIEKDDFLLKKYCRIYLLMPSPEFTPVPSPLYDPGRRDEYLVFNHGDNENRAIFSNRLNEIDSFVVFAVSKPLLETVSNYFPTTFPSHHLKPLFSHMVHSAKAAGSDYIHLHIESDYFTMAVFRDQGLHYLNVFRYRNVSDIIYFVLNGFKTLGISAETTVHLSGMTERYDDLTSVLSLYVKNLSFAIPGGNFTFSYVFNDVPLHRFINLYTILNCD